MADARQVARWVVDDIAADIKDRKGIGNEYEEIDEDIRRKMLIGWIDLVEAYVKKYDSR